MEAIRQNIPLAVAKIAEDPHATNLLAGAHTDDGREAFGAYSWTVLVGGGMMPDGWAKVFLEEFLSWCSKSATPVPQTLRNAIADRTAGRVQARRNRRNFMVQNYLHPASAKVQPPPVIPEIVVEEHHPPYPPLGHWICESRAIYDNWVDEIATCKLADNRKDRRPCHLLDTQHLLYDIKADESRAILGSDGSLQALVIRDFCGDRAAMGWVDGVIRAGSKVKKSARVSTVYIFAVDFN